MKCDKNKETASLYLSDMLSEAERAEFERHLETCEECRAEVERYRRMIGLVQNLPRAHAPEGLHRAVMQKVASREKKTALAGFGGIFRLRVFRAVAAVLILAVGTGLAFYAHYSTRDIDPQVAEKKIYDKTPAEEARVARDTLDEASPTRPSFETAAGALPPAGHAHASADMPGSVEPAAFFSNIKNVDKALKNMDYDDLNDLAAKNHDTIMTFAEAQSAPEFNETLASSPGDRNVYRQLAQKRVIVNALRKTEDFEKAESITQTLDADDKKQRALKTEAPKNKVAEMEPDAEEEERIMGATETKRNVETKEEIRVYERILRERDSAHMRPPGTYRFRAKDNATKDATLVFQQELILAPQAFSGRETILDEERKSDLKLVFDNLPTLENYSVEKFTKNGFTVRLSEEEFLHLLKYIKDVGGIRAELSPIQATLEIEEPERTMKAMDEIAGEKTIDPYAVNLKIRILEE